MALGPPFLTLFLTPVLIPIAVTIIAITIRLKNKTVKHWMSIRINRWMNGKINNSNSKNERNKNSTKSGYNNQINTVLFSNHGNNLIKEYIIN
jgi:hypothetical protein